MNWCGLMNMIACKNTAEPRNGIGLATGRRWVELGIYCRRQDHCPQMVMQLTSCPNYYRVFGQVLEFHPQSITGSGTWETISPTLVGWPVSAGQLGEYWEVTTTIIWKSLNIIRQMGIQPRSLPAINYWIERSLNFTSSELEYSWWFGGGGGGRTMEGRDLERVPQG